MTLDIDTIIGVALVKEHVVSYCQKSKVANAVLAIYFTVRGILPVVQQNTA